VVEQSELARLPPLTYVSVQSEGEQAGTGPEVLSLDAAERAILHEELFRGDLTEGLLHRIGQSRGESLHEVALDARGVSAHARLAAALA
jgi:hypothetical protein